MANMIGRAEELTRQERKTLRAQIRALRKQAMGIRLCGAKTRRRRGSVWQPRWRTADAECTGASTGPKTGDGRQRAIEALKRYHAEKSARNG